MVVMFRTWAHGRIDRQARWQLGGWVAVRACINPPGAEPPENRPPVLRPEPPHCGRIMQPPSQLGRSPQRDVRCFVVVAAVRRMIGFLNQT